MKVKELIEKLSKFNPNTEVVYSSYSESIQMSVSNVEIEQNQSNLQEDVIAIQE